MQPDSDFPDFDPHLVEHAATEAEALSRRCLEAGAPRDLVRTVLLMGFARPLFDDMDGLSDWMLRNGASMAPKPPEGAPVH